MLVLLLATCPAHAVIRVAAETGAYDDIRWEGLDLSLAPALDGPAPGLDAAPRLAVELSIAKLDFGSDYGTRFERLRWRCTLQTSVAGRVCTGPVSARSTDGAVRGKLELALSDDRFEARLTRNSARLTLELPRTLRPGKIELDDVPLDWLAGLLRYAVDAAVVGGGLVDAKLELGDDPLLQGAWAIEQVAFDTPDGRMAAAGLDARGTLTFGGTVDARRVQTSGSLTRGEWLIAPLYVKLPAQPVEFSVDAAGNASGWQIASWSWRDAGALFATGSASLAADAALRRLDATFEIELPDAYARYAQGLLAPAGLGDLATQGKVSGRVTRTLDESSRSTTTLEASAAGVSIEDGAGRFGIAALNGEFAVGSDGSERTLRWSAGSLFGFPIGPATLVARSDAQGWRLAEPLALTLLDGTLAVDRLLYAATPMGGSRIDAGFTVTDLSIAQLTRRFDWPEFGGTLSGRIPAMRSEDGKLQFEGGLALDLFGGKVAIDALELERPFGVAPSLAADIALDDLDLGKLTNTFSFGGIEGRLDGRIDGLRLVDWTPVSFDLALHTDQTYRGRRRISQRAVNSLSSVGGAGAGAGLQQTMMKLFDTFPYAEIGLRCKLASNVCEMGGLEPGVRSERPAYTIVRGSGLPHLTVQGFQRQVDWPVLVERLKAATTGAGPVIQ